MKIAVWHNLPGGGGKRALHDHVMGLVDRGHTVESWCPPTADQLLFPLGRLIREHTIPLSTVEPRTPKAAVGRISGGATRVLSLLRAMDQHAACCAAEIDGGGFDVVLSNSCFYLGATCLGRHLRTPAVLYLQEPYRRLYEACPALPWPALPKNGKGPVVRGVERFQDSAMVRALRIQAREELASVLAFQRLLCNSYFSRESMLRAYGVDANVCYLGVDTERFKKRELPRRRMVIGVGLFGAHKRIDFVIDTIAGLPPPRPELVWIGGAPLPGYVEALRSLANRKGVKFVPHINATDQEVVGLLSQAAVMAYAPRLEPFGYAPLEAAACGLPVVAMAEGGIRETVVHGETGILASDASQFASGLEHLLNDSDLARRMGEAGRRRVKLDWNAFDAVSRLESHLLEVAGCADQ